MIEYIEKFLGISEDIQLKLYYSVALLSFLWLIQKIVTKWIINKIESLDAKYQWNKYIRYTVGILSVLLLLSIWIGGIGPVGTYLGLLSAGIAIALKDLLINFTGWMFIIVRKPFKVGDRIQIEDMTGDVIDIRIFQFSVIEVGNWVDADQSTGRIIHVPNGIVHTKRQANYTQGFEYIWNEIPVLLTFESDWEKAKRILTEILNNIGMHFSREAESQIKRSASKFMIFYEDLAPIVYTSVKDSGVLLTIRYLCHAKNRRNSEQELWESILKEFGKHGSIELAYPTQRFYNYSVEKNKGSSDEVK